ncbi:kinase-like domain-containing protein [Phellopilus nigrolimitatus]|nr:kinase-like domain-containing protein [Phellopilus nigrolimitatus]
MSQTAKRTSVTSAMLLLLHPAKQKNYEIHEEIGRGAYGKAVRATWHEPRTESEDQTSKEELPSKTVALKIVKKRKFLYPNREASSAVELKHLQNLDHPNIVKVYEVFESFSCYYISLEHLDGGELFARIHERSGDQFREADAVRIVKSVLKGIEYLHRKNIVHHDIKASNILFRTKARDSDVVIVDFGISRRLSSPYERLHGLRGTLPYLAPEVLMRKGYGREIDMWALGCVAPRPYLTLS